MKTISVIGLGNRGSEYMLIIKVLHKKDAKVVALCDTNPQALIDLAPKYKIDKDHQFGNTDDFFKQGVLSDGLIIATQDKSHYEIAKKAILVGYKKILLEKPVSDNISECEDLAKLAKENNVTLVVCHVLRYSNFFKKIKEVLRSKELGEIIHINHIENVAYYHFAHSYVRGNWKKEETSTNSLLAKCCHDIDLIYWFNESNRASEVSSYGDLTYFTSKNAPEGATSYCLKGCKVKKNCPYDCEYTYLTVPFYKANFIKYQHRTMTGKLHASKKDMYDCLNNTSYGKCVFLNDNNVCDYQVVNMKFTNGVTATHTLNAFSKDMYRSGKIMCTKGEIIYSDNTLVVNKFGKGSKTYHPAIPFIPGHGEGDIRLINSFVDLLNDRLKNEEDLTSIEETLESHKIIMAAEASRHHNSKIHNPIEDYK